MAGLTGRPPDAAGAAHLVRLAAGYEHLDAPAIRVAPALEPAAAEAGNGTQGAPGFLVDGEPRALRLDRRDAAHAVLVEEVGSATGTGVVLEAPRPDPVAGTVRREVVVDGWRFEVEVEPARRAELRERASRASGGAVRGGPTEIRAVIPGRVLRVAVAVGDDVEAGHAMLVVEAMKMQNEVRAPRNGTVTRVATGDGQTVEVGDLLVVLE